MKDILINPDGTPRIIDGDFAETTYGEYLAQKVYRALMNISPRDISGGDETKPEESLHALEAYFASYFANDPDIEVSGLKVALVNRGGQNLSVSVSYTGSAPDGTKAETTQGMSYDMAAGSIKSIDYSPGWLRMRDDPDQELVSLYITIDDHTTEVELPVEPSLSNTVPPGSDSTTARTFGYDDALYEGLVDRSAEISSTRITTDPIYLCPVTGTDYPSATDVTLSLTIDPQTIMYPVSRYLDGFDASTDLVLSVTLDTVPTGVDVVVKEEAGEVALLVISGEGTITGTAKVVQAKYATYDYRVADEQAREHVFPLRPTRGRFLAVFPRSVAPGTYMLQYKGNRERKVF